MLIEKRDYGGIELYPTNDKDREAIHILEKTFNNVEVGYMEMSVSVNMFEFSFITYPIPLEE